MRIELDIKDEKLANFILNGKEQLEDAKHIICIISDGKNVTVGATYIGILTFRKMLETLEKWSENPFNIMLSKNEEKFNSRMIEG